MSSLKVELKVNCPTNDVPMCAEFKECRLYPKPSTNPVHFVVTQWPAPLFLLPDMRVKLSVAATGDAIGEMVTDKWASGAIDLPDSLDYPLACKVEVYRKDELVVELAVEADGVEGLYPGDHWGISLREGV